MFPNQVSLIAFEYLSYRFYEKFNNLLILLSPETTGGDIKELNKIANTADMQYVLNFRKVELYKNKGIGYAKISMQLYDNVSGRLLINSDYEGDWTNPGFEFCCEEKSIFCMINNALSKALYDVIYQVASESPTLKLEREVALHRNEILTDYCHTNSNDTEFLKSIIHPSDSNIVLKHQYQLLTDPSKTKFVAFFIEQVESSDFKSLKDKKGDNSVNIIVSDIVELDDLDNVPDTYAYIVKGVKYNDKWYYEKSNATYFETANLEEGKEQYFFNLAGWNFFKENSTELNPDFWETNLFEKVESSAIKNKKEIEEITALIATLETDEEKAYLKELLEDYNKDDLKNKKYFGIYEIVADQLIYEDAEETKLFTANIVNELLPQFFESYCKWNNLKGYIKLNGNEFALIFPGDKSFFLTPVVLDYGQDKKELRYFLIIPEGGKENTVYEWVYFKPVSPEYCPAYGSDVVDQMSQLTKWDFSFDYLDDTDFWNNYVLLKADGGFKYLRKVN